MIEPMKYYMKKVPAKNLKTMKAIKIIIKRQKSELLKFIDGNILYFNNWKG